MKKPLVVYDWEVFSNFACVCFESLWSDQKLVIEISNRVNTSKQLKSITDWYTLVGYNNHNYDDPLTQMLLTKKNVTNKELFEMSQTLVKNSYNRSDEERKAINRYKYNKEFDSIDFMTMLASSKLRVSLKHLQVKIKWPKVLDFEVNWNEELPEDRFDECISYCFNDVSSLKAVVLSKSKDLDLRDKIQAKYGMDFRSMDGVKIAETMLCTHIAKGLGVDLKEFMYQENQAVPFILVKDLINDFVEFKTDEFKKVLEYFKTVTLVPTSNEEENKKQLSYRLVVNGVAFDMGLGGIHGYSKGEVIEPKLDEFLLMPDVSSYYPSQIVSIGYPHRYDPYFIDKYKEAYIDKAEGKRTKDAMREWLAKLMLNSSFGKMLSIYSPLYSCSTAYRITINGQLMLLMLIEALTLDGFKIVGANTDAIEVLVPKERYNDYLSICNGWSEITKMSLDHDKFVKIYRKSCNHYIGIKANPDGTPQIDENGRFKVKLKGDFEQESDLLKGAKPTIIKIAIFEELVYGTPIAKTVKEHTDIYDFCMSSRIGREFKTVHAGNTLQKTNRYYAGKGPDSSYIYKVKKADNSEQHILKESKVIIFNDYVEKPMSEYNINYAYYINEAQKIVDQIKPRQLTLF